MPVYLYIREETEQEREALAKMKGLLSSVENLQVVEVRVDNPATLLGLCMMTGFRQLVSPVLVNPERGAYILSGDDDRPFKLVASLPKQETAPVN